MTDNLIAVSTNSSALSHEAERIAAQLNLKFIHSPQEENAFHYAYLLLVTPDYIGLYNTHDKKIKPFYIDFLSGKMRYRSHQAGLRNELLARAIGISPRHHPLIVDATAGLGRDSFILATLGFHVIMLERSPILHILLENALNRAKQDSNAAAIVERLQLIHTYAIYWLKTAPNPDIIYLDPMFPIRQKTASIKKEMAILQDLLGKDTDSAALFEVALSCATNRVVVKRPRLGAYLAEHTPNFSKISKANRFDIYLI